MKRTTGFTLAAGVALLLTMASCTSAADPAGSAAAGGGSEGGDIAYVPPVSDSPFFTTIGCGIKEAVTAAGYTFSTQAPPTFDATQQAQVVQAVQQRGPVALVVDVVGTAQMAPVLATAARTTTVVTSLEPITFEGQSGAVEFDQVEFGTLQAQQLVQAMGETGKVYLVDYQAGSATLDARAQGIEAELAKHPGITVVGHDYAVGDPTRAAQLTAAALQANPDLTGVITTDVYSTPGVVNAVATAGEQDQVKIVSADLVDSTVQQVKDGTIVGFIASKNFELGQASGQAAVDALAGTPQQVPTYIDDAYLPITADNIDMASDEAYAPRTC